MMKNQKSDFLIHKLPLKNQSPSNAHCKIQDKEVFHLYQINVKNRDKLMNFLIKNNVDAKIHYPIPIHLQPAAKFLKYKKGDFPVAEKLARTSISLPVHEFIKKQDVFKMAELINSFYRI